MNNQHISIFTKIKENESNTNPIKEYIKIKSFLKENSFMNDILEKSFVDSKKLRASYVDLDKCLKPITTILDNFTISKKIYEQNSIANNEIILDTFLNYCEIIIHLYNLSKNIYQKNDIFEYNKYLQFYELIENSLLNLDYAIEETNQDILLVKNNLEARAIAYQAPIDLKEAILHYLSIKDQNIKDKELWLHQIIDQLEPLIKIYRNLRIIDDLTEYLQLLRHPEEKKKENQYKWYYDNKNLYFDKIFNMCLFVKEYDLTKTTLDEFKKLKQEAI